MRTRPQTWALGAVFLVSLAGAAAAAEPLAHTYSVVARDPETGALGVAVQSHWPGVGALCAWARPGVGVVATQAKTRTRYGAEGLRRMAAGEPALAALASMLAADPEAEARQVALVDAGGTVAVHTGKDTIPASGHEAGEGFSVQANMMVSDAVVPAMARAYRAAEGPLAERLVATLEAAQAAGGDLRGQQAAVLLVVSGDPADQVDGVVELDLRVDDHPEAVAELARLLRLRRAYDAGLQASAMLSRGPAAAAERHFDAAANRAGRPVEPEVWFAVALAQAGHWSRAARRLGPHLAEDPAWEAVLRRLPGTSVLPDSEAGRRFVEALLARAR